jgi:hypothetical protein
MTITARDGYEITTSNDANVGEFAVCIHVETRDERMLRRSNELAEAAMLCGLAGYETMAVINAEAADMCAQLAVVMGELEKL